VIREAFSEGVKNGFTNFPLKAVPEQVDEKDEKSTKFITIEFKNCG